jgi:thiamine-phosphate pyrophosphorylase
MSSLHAARMDRFGRAGLYLVTSQCMSEGRSTLDIISAALAGGVTLIQLREKDLPARALHELATEARALTAAADALLIINDRLDIALAVGADGVHLGQNDLPLTVARRLAPEMILGASSHDVPEARAAQMAGASYVNIGPLFPTQTKLWTEAYLGIEGLKEIAGRVDIPFTVMGGIKTHHILDLRAAGADTIALVTAVTAQPDPEQAARDLLELIHNPTGRS